MDKRIKTLKAFLKSLLNNNCIDLIVPFKEIKKLDKFYKENYGNYKVRNQNDFDNFMSKNSDFQKKINLSRSAFLEVEKQFFFNKALQPAILTECFLAQTIANLYSLDTIICNYKNEPVPSKITNLLNSAYGHHGSNFRYLFFNSNKQDVILTQNGDPSSVDAFFVKDKFLFRIEFKENVARIQEKEIVGGYDENGKLIYDNEFNKNYPYYAKLIDYFNKQNSVFDLLGENFKISSLIDNNLLKQILNSSATQEKIDLYVFAGQKKLFPILPDLLSEYVNYDTSEIRSAGKNSYKVFTPLFLDKTLAKLGATKLNANDDYAVDESKLTNRISRGKKGSTLSGKKLNSIFWIPQKHYKVLNGKIVFNKNNIKQIRCTISVHLKLNEKADFDKQLKYI